MSLSKTFQKMQQLSNEIGLLKAKNNLNMDYRLLKKYGDINYVFMLSQECSILFPLNVEENPMIVEFYINNDQSARYFKMSGNENTDFIEIGGDEAAVLVSKSEINFDEITCKEDLIDKVELRLQDYQVSSFMFSTPALSSRPVDWEGWLDWFSDNSSAMESLMKNAIKRLSELSG